MGGSPPGRAKRMHAWQGRTNAQSVWLPPSPSRRRSRLSVAGRSSGFRVVLPPRLPGLATHESSGQCGVRHRLQRRVRSRVSRLSHMAEQPCMTCNMRVYIDGVEDSVKPENGFVGIFLPPMLPGTEASRRCEVAAARWRVGSIRHDGLQAIADARRAGRGLEFMRSGRFVEAPANDGLLGRRVVPNHSASGPRIMQKSNLRQE